MIFINMRIFGNLGFLGAPDFGGHVIAAQQNLRLCKHALKRMPAFMDRRTAKFPVCFWHELELCLLPKSVLAMIEKRHKHDPANPSLCFC
jgi:hypothetical protein